MNAYHFNTLQNLKKVVFGLAKWYPNNYILSLINIYQNNFNSVVFLHIQANSVVRSIIHLTIVERPSLVVVRTNRQNHICGPGRKQDKCRLHHLHLGFSSTTWYNWEKNVDHHPLTHSDLSTDAHQKQGQQNDVWQWYCLLTRGGMEAPYTDHITSLPVGCQTLLDNYQYIKNKSQFILVQTINGME